MGRSCQNTNSFVESASPRWSASDAGINVDKWCDGLVRAQREHRLAADARSLCHPQKERSLVSTWPVKRLFAPSCVRGWRSAQSAMKLLKNIPAVVWFFS